jgi:hypothetical protein
MTASMADAFDDWLDEIADEERHDQSNGEPTLTSWAGLHPTYRAAWRQRALRRARELLLERVLAEYDEDTGRAPSFVTMHLIRCTLNNITTEGTK